MPPRKRREPETEDDSDLDVSKPADPTSALIPNALRKIDKIKSERTKARKTISHDFDDWLAEERTKIESLFDAEAAKRETEAKDLFQSYTAAIERRRATEISITQLLNETQLDKIDIARVLKLLHSGGQETALRARGAAAPFVSPPPTAKAKEDPVVSDAGKPLQQPAWDAGLSGTFRDDGKSRRVVVKTRDDARKGGSVFDRDDGWDYPSTAMAVRRSDPIARTAHALFKELREENEDDANRSTVQRGRLDEVVDAGVMHKKSKARPELFDRFAW